MSLRDEIANEITYSYTRAAVTGHWLGQSRETADKIMDIFRQHFQARMVAADPTADVDAPWLLLFDPEGGAAAGEDRAALGEDTE